MISVTDLTKPNFKITHKNRRKLQIQWAGAVSDKEWHTKHT